MDSISIKITIGKKRDELGMTAKVSLGFIPFLTKIEFPDERYSAFFPYDTQKLKKELKLKTDKELELYELISSLPNVKGYQDFHQSDKFKSGNIIVIFDDRLDAQSINTIGQLSSRSKESILFYPIFTGINHDRIYLVCTGYDNKDGFFHEGAINAIREINGLINATKLKFYLKKSVFDNGGTNWFGKYITEQKEAQSIATDEILS